MSIETLQSPFTYAGKATRLFNFEDANGNKAEQIFVEIELLNDGVDTQGTPIAGQKIWFFGSFAQKKADAKADSVSAEEITLKALRTMGWTSDDIETLDGLGSTEFDVGIAPHTYEGKTSNRIKFIGSGGGRPMPKSELAGPKLKAFAARMLNAAKASRGASAPSTHAGPPPLRATGTEGAHGAAVDSNGTLVAPGGKKLF